MLSDAHVCLKSCQRTPCFSGGRTPGTCLPRSLEARSRALEVVVDEAVPQRTAALDREDERLWSGVGRGL